ncbi:MAG TPA: 2-C-methyl-D-erythritol 4-phosphate cytidylyltransferase [Acidimicrobiales bacterium]|nr:2-C-methyl-D-erythritol 4-phosphate cytidylyltransferase [Acidimicrobiales bacterium]
MIAWAIVVAAGRGTRFGGPKQFERLEGRTLLEWSVSAARSSCQGVVVALPEPRPPAGALAGLEGCRLVSGGATRSESVRAGLAEVPEEADAVVVHDAVRPLAGRALFEAVLGALEAGAEAAVPCVEPPDTLKRVGEGLVVATLPRGEVVCAQTPQAFRAGLLRRAHSGAAQASDDAALVEALGVPVAVVEGDPANLKVTAPADLDVVRCLARR